jgi:hypothetical protein
MMKLNLLLLSAAALVNAATAVDPVILGAAKDYTILAKSGISNEGASMITDDIAVYPITSAAITGFDLVMDTDEESSTSTKFTGKAFASDYEPPTPETLITAVSDMQTAYNDAASRPVTSKETTNLKAGLIGGETLTTGVYKFTTDINIGANIYFEGTKDDVFVIQTSGSVVQAANTQVILKNGALAKNIIWQVAKEVKVGAGAHLEGVLLVKTAVTFITGSSLRGRVLAQTACTLGETKITPPPDASSRRLR